MAEYPIIRGANQEEKNSSIQQILKTLSRRVTRRATVYIPPVPLFISCDVVPENNIIGAVVVPFRGTIQDLFIRIGEMRTKVVELSLTIVSDASETRVDFVVTSSAFRAVVDMHVSAGALLQLTLKNGSLARIYVATALYPDLEYHKAREYLLAEILKEPEEEENAVHDEKE